MPSYFCGLFVKFAPDCRIMQCFHSCHLCLAAGSNPAHIQLSRHQQFQAALVLVLSNDYLHQTSWLPHSWSKRNVLLQPSSAAPGLLVYADAEAVVAATVAVSSTLSSLPPALAATAGVCQTWQGKIDAVAAAAGRHWAEPAQPWYRSTTCTPARPSSRWSCRRARAISLSASCLNTTRASAHRAATSCATCPCGCLSRGSSAGPLHTSASSSSPASSS
jgi:hypothetical protein